MFIFVAVRRSKYVAMARYSVIVTSLLTAPMTEEFEDICLYPGCSNKYTGITKKNVRQNLSEHIKRVHKMSLVEYRRKHETPEALEAREALQRQREARGLGWTKYLNST